MIFSGCIENNFSYLSIVHSKVACVDAFCRSPICGPTRTSEPLFIAKAFFKSLPMANIGVCPEISQ